MHAPSAPGVFTCFAAFVLVLMFGASAAAQAPGCTDAGACNFDPAAFFKNGTCVYLSLT